MSPRNLLISFVVLFLLVTGGIYAYVSSVTSTGLPSLELLENPRQNLASQVLSSDGELLDHFYIQRRVSLPLDSIPQDFINALVATEDRAFWDHWGVHTERIFKAAVKNIIEMDVTGEGASTITMQLARNLFLNFENSLDRKIREAYTAMQIEKTYTKREILEMYSNTVLFGRGAYGIYVASKYYFDKHPKELTTAQCAYLVGLLKYPEYYNGFRHPERAIRRRNLVLKLMYDQNYITQDNYLKSIEEPLNMSRGRSHGRETFLAPHFVENIRQKLSQANILSEYDLYRDGLIIHTSLDSRIQKYAVEAIGEHLADLQDNFDRRWSWRGKDELLKEILSQAVREHPDYQAAQGNNKKAIANKLKSNKKFIDSVKNHATTIQCGLVVLNPLDGSVLAMVGASPKFMRENAEAKYSLNHATQIARQPGSAFKPFVYAKALEMGYQPYDLIECSDYSFELPDGTIWEPNNPTECEPGQLVTLYDALRRSINSVAARLITQVVKPHDVVSLIYKMGISTPLQAVYAIALGAGGDVKPIDITSAYGSFLYNGLHVEPHYYNRIEDHFGNVIREKTESINVNDVLDKKIAAQMTRMLQGVVSSGTAIRIKNYLTDVEAAGKTGTTNDYADAWFVGFTPELVAGVWVGFDNRRITFEAIGADGQGGRAAAPIWGRLMAKVYGDESLPFRKYKFPRSALDSLDSLSRMGRVIQGADEYESAVPQTSTTDMNNRFPKLPKKDNNEDNRQ
ncbi:MAG: penicillin-binding protein 1A [Candidatus Kapaibacterium sp.]